MMPSLRQKDSLSRSVGSSAQCSSFCENCKYCKQEKKISKNKYKTFSQQCGEQKSWTSQLNVVVIMALPVHMSLLPVAGPAPPPVALLHPECVTIDAQTQSEVLSEQ